MKASPKYSAQRSSYSFGLDPLQVAEPAIAHRRGLTHHAAAHYPQPRQIGAPHQVEQGRGGNAGLGRPTPATLAGAAGLEQGQAVRQPPLVQPRDVALQLRVRVIDQLPHLRPKGRVPVHLPHEGDQVGRLDPSALTEALDRCLFGDRVEQLHEPGDARPGGPPAAACRPG
ncbi:MAG: hypothetical protein AB1505_31765 [Candidatus Latescibacterota bacterium]